jgi:hypothetical protein
MQRRASRESLSFGRFPGDAGPVMSTVGFAAKVGEADE